MSKIYLVNGSTTRTVESLVTARVRDSLDSELTLSFTLTADDAAYISDTTKVRYNGQYFSVISYDKDTDGQSPVCAVECEHISYMLNNDEYTLENFVFNGTPAAALAAVLNGTPFTAGTVEPTSSVNISITGGTRRAVLVSVAALMGGEIDYNGYAINIRTHRGSVPRVELTDTYNVTHISYTRDVREQITSYTVNLGRKTTLAAGDEIHIAYTPLSLDVNTRITAIEYNPYKDSEVDIEVGDYVPDILDTYTAISEKVIETAATVEAIAADYTTRAEVGASIDTYVNSEAGTAKIISACSGTYATEDEINGLTTETDVQNIISQEISETGGSIKLFVEGKSYITQTTADSRYTKQTELYSGIEQYVDTAAGTAKIISACSGTYQTKSGMSDYAKTTDVNAAIITAISEESASITAAVSSTYQTKSGMSDYAKTTDVNAAITTAVSEGTASVLIDVSATYQTKSDMGAYPKTAQMESSINTAISGIDMTTSAAVSGNQTTSTIALSRGGVSISTATIVGTTAAQAMSIANTIINSITLNATTTTANNQTTSTLTLKNGTSTITSTSVIGTTAAQVATITASAVNGIKLSVATTTANNQTTSTLTLKNGTSTITSTSVIGTTAAQVATITADAINGITLSVANAAAQSTLTIKSGSTTLSSAIIKFTGVVQFTDLSTEGNTTINGANIKTGKISAERIEVDDIHLKKIFGATSTTKPLIDCSEQAAIYIGGTSSDVSVGNVYIRANACITIGYWGTYSSQGYTFTSGSNPKFSPMTTNTSSIGELTKVWMEAYVRDIYATELWLGTRTSYGATGYITARLEGSAYVLGPFSTNQECDLGSLSKPWDYAFIAIANIGTVTANIATTSSAKLGFFGKVAATRQTLSTSYNNMSYSAVTANNYLVVLNNLIGILVNKYGLIN